jgi:hypothetical protein
MVMAFSTDSDLTAIVPDILSLGIDSFADEHAKAEADIKREIRRKWWPRTQFKGEMNESLLTDSQWTRANVYLVLWKYALPKLTNWVDGDRFREMISFYRDLHSQEMESVFNDGVEYDEDEDGTIQNDEKDLFVAGRLTR